MAAKTQNPKAWLFVLPVVLLVAFNALIPLMTVVNYSVQETFGDNVFFWEGVKWYEQVLHSGRFHAALGLDHRATGEHSTNYQFLIYRSLKNEYNFRL